MVSSVKLLENRVIQWLALIIVNHTKICTNRALPAVSIEMMSIDRGGHSMRWKAKNKAEAGTILRLLATQGEPLFKKLDEGAKVEKLQIQAREAAMRQARQEHYDETAVAG